MKRARWKPLREALLGVSVASLVGYAMASCAGTPDPNRITQVLTPRFDQFTGNPAQGVAGVDGLLERRCATLDCHGQVGRPLRIFGSRGLRILDDGGNSPGGALTTQAELVANFQAVVALEPEIMTQVIFDPGNNPPTRLLIVKKPLGLETHKGGSTVNPVIVPGSDADRCLQTWIQGTIDANACASAQQVP